MVKAQPKKKPLPTLSKLKGKLDAIFSQYIRLKHSDHFGYCTCYTCDKRMPWKDIQNGHLFKRNKLGTRFDEQNCRPQCFQCNCRKDGNYTEYFPRIIREIGQDALDHLEMQSKSAIKLDRDFYARNIEFYTAAVKELLAQKEL